MKAGDEYCPMCRMKTGNNTHQFACPRCGEPLNDNVRFCHRCGLSLVEGYEQEKAHEKKKNPLSGIIALPIRGCLTFGVYYVFLEHQ